MYKYFTVNHISTCSDKGATINIHTSTTRVSTHPVPVPSSLVGMESLWIVPTIHVYLCKRELEPNLKCSYSER